MKKRFQALFIALAASAISIFTPLYSIEGKATFEYAQTQDLLELDFFGDANELEVNIMCVKGLKFDDGFSYRSTQNGKECMITCEPIEGKSIFHDGREVQKIEVYVTVTNAEEPRSVKVMFEACEVYLKQVNEDGIATNASSRHTIETSLKCPHISPTSEPTYYLYENDFSDISFGFRFK